MLCSSPFSRGVSFNPGFAGVAASGNGGPQKRGCSGDSPRGRQRVPLAQRGTLLPCGVQPGHGGVRWGAAWPGVSLDELPAPPAPPHRAGAAVFYNVPQQNLKRTGNNSTIKRIQLCLFAFKLTLGMK